MRFISTSIATSILLLAGGGCNGTFASETKSTSSTTSSHLRGLQQQDDSTHAVCKQVNAVTNFNLDKYVSKPWYIHQQAEIEFQPIEQNYCTRALYNIRDSRSIPWGYTVDVNNYSQDIDGNAFGGPLCAYQKKDDVEGNVGKLNVAPCFLPRRSAGPYWIVDYVEDEIDGYALISGGQPTIPTDKVNPTTGETLCTTGDGINNSGLWLLFRSPIRNDALIEKVRQIAIDNGFDISILNDVVHDDTCMYPEGTEEEGDYNRDEMEDDGEDDTEEEGEDATVVECPKDVDGTFGTIFGQRDCEWVGNKWKPVRCWFHSSECPVTCGVTSSVGGSGGGVDNVVSLDNKGSCN